MSKYKEDIIRLRKQGKSYREIENKLGCSRGNISYHCKQEGLEDIGKKQKEVSDEKKEKIRKYYKNHTGEQTAKRFDVSESTVQKYSETKESQNHNRKKSNTTRKGDASEALVVAKYIEKGYNVLTPVNDGVAYDLVVEKNGKLYKVQVKRGRKEKNVISFRCCSQTRSNGNIPYTKNEVDLFTIHEPKSGNVYEVKFDEAPKTQMYLRTEISKANKRKNMNMAADYKI